MRSSTAWPLVAFSIVFVACGSSGPSSVKAPPKGEPSTSPAASSAPAVASASSASSASSSASAMPAKAGPLSHDDAIAQLVVAGYDVAKHRFPIQLVADPDGGNERYRVTSTRRDTRATYRTDVTAAGTVNVTVAKGTGWAAGLEVDWVVVGDEPGMCGTQRGWLALVRFEADAPSLVALAPWEACDPGAKGAMFVTAAGRKLLLEPDADAGEESPTHSFYRVWSLEGDRFANLGEVRSSLEDFRDGSAVGGFMRKMTATVDGVDGGLHVKESWTFTPLKKGPARSRTVEYVLRIDKAGVAAPPADPRP